MKLIERMNILKVWMFQKLRMEEPVYYVCNGDTLPYPLTAEEEQQYLKLDSNTPIVRLTDLQFDTNGMPLFASRITYDSRRFQWGMIFMTKL